MPSQSDSRIEERLIGDALTDHMDRKDDTRELWPDIRDRLSQRRRTKLPIFVRVAAATAIVSLLALLVIVRPWSLLDDSMTPFAAVAHAYDGLLELETVHYRVDGSSFLGPHYSTLHQVNLVNHIAYGVTSFGPDSDGDSPLPGPASTINFSRFESILINGKSYSKFTMSAGEQQEGTYGWSHRMSRDGDEVIRVEDGEWTLDAEVTGWEPFGKLGGLPWSREVAEDQFDQVELVGVSEIDGQPAVHYHASRTRRSVASDVHGLSTMVFDPDDAEAKIAKIVYRGTNDFEVSVDTVDLWLTPNGSRLIRVDWTTTEQPLSSPIDVDGRDWCEGLGDYDNIRYHYRPASDPVPGFRTYGFDNPMDSDSYKLLKIICWNRDRSEGRVVWGRSMAEEIGEDIWRRMIYTFTAFNEPLDLPSDMPE